MSSFSFRRGLGPWLRESLKRRGVAGAAGFALGSVVNLARDLTPERRRLRFGDLEFDWENHVDTTWANIPLRTRLREIVSNGQYQPSDPYLFAEIMEAVEGAPEGIELSDFTFIDYGSGKGRALLMAAEFPFRKIIGVELLPELHQIAVLNLERYQGGAHAGRIELWNGDAREFPIPADPLFVFLNNPFPAPVLEAVLANLSASLRKYPRRLLLVYANPLLERVVLSAGFLHKTGGTHQYSVFENEPSVKDMDSA
jgi:SAM-dependent methyltransferase